MEHWDREFHVLTESPSGQSNPVSHPSGGVFDEVHGHCSRTFDKDPRRCRHTSEGIACRGHWNCNTVCSRSNRKLTKVLMSISCAVSTHHLPPSCVYLLKSFKLLTQIPPLFRSLVGSPQLKGSLFPHSYIIESFEHLSQYLSVFFDSESIVHASVFTLLAWRARR